MVQDFSHQQYLSLSIPRMIESLALGRFPGPSGSSPKTLCHDNVPMEGPLWWTHWWWSVWVVVSNIFYFPPYLGKIPILTNIFENFWNGLKPPTRCGCCPDWIWPWGFYVPLTVEAIGWWTGGLGEGWCAIPEILTEWGFKQTLDPPKLK